ncbi:MAG: aldehyde dehydrogenase [Euryarchaeota archaeon]|nr:aldehyde dehydrogenase [Euryarchaeota archaeon]
MALPPSGLGDTVAESYKMYLGGKWVEAESGKRTDVLNPATNTTIASVPEAGPVEAKNAIAVAAAAVDTPEWRDMDPSRRGSILSKIASIIREQRDALALLETQNNGKTIKEAKGDMNYVARTFDYYAGLADKIEGTTIPVPGARLNYTLREPLGVTVHIAPWNYPLLLACRSVAPALAAGNTVILKPASITPVTALKLGEVAEKAGLPAGVLQVVTGSGSVLGKALASDPRVDAVAFTGSADTGREIMKYAAPNVTPVTLELGGKSPNIVFADADVKAASRGVVTGIFSNAGQMCWAGSRLLVHGSIHETLLSEVSRMASALKVGNGSDDKTEMGPVASRSQMERVMKYVETGKKEGATLVTGGERAAEGELAKGNFVKPTIFDGVALDATIAREEIFGPVLTVFKFKDFDDAMRIANHTDFGLFSGVWTNSLVTAHTAAARIKAGMVSINEYPITFPQTPFGGYKDSGIGYEQGLAAVASYTRVKNVSVNIAPPKKAK